MQIELSEQQVQAIKELMGRATLSGKEVPIYVDLLNALNNALKSAIIQPKKEEKDAIQG